MGLRNNCYSEPDPALISYSQIGQPFSPTRNSFLNNEHKYAVPRRKKDAEFVTTIQRFALEHGKRQDFLDTV